MLTGDDGILKRAGEAKERTEYGEIKEILDLKLLDYIGNKKIGEESTLFDYFNSYKGKDRIDNVTDNGDESITVASGKYKFIIDENGVRLDAGDEENQTNNKIKLSFNEKETESRAVILEVSIIKEEPPSIEEWLRTLSTEELKTMFANGMTGGMATWDEACAGITDVEDWYNKRVGNPNSDAYKFMIQNKWYDEEKYNKTYATPPTTIICNGESQEYNEKAEFVVTKNGNYIITANNENGESGKITAKVTKCKIETFSDIQNSNYTLNKDGYEVVIPAGFAYGSSNNVGTVTKGLVITDSIDSNHYSTGNEFVWIPVDKTSLTVGKTNNKMAENVSGSDYIGVLYTKQDSIKEDLKEPIYLTAGGDASQYNKIGITQESLQKEYNDMIASITKYGGFYVARYELGKDAISKINVEPTSAAEEETKTWYGLYSKSKSYTNSKNSVVSSMIWGSQWDAVLNFGLTNSSDSSKVSENNNGNHTGKLLKTGVYQGKDSINNIFDLEGNMWEWTLEGYSNSSRVYRGGGFTGGKNKPNNRGVDGDPFRVINNAGSRVTLYIKK